MKRIIIAISALSFLTSACTSTTEVTGNIDIYEDFDSQLVAPRAVRVWTPADYDPHRK